MSSPEPGSSAEASAPPPVTPDDRYIVVRGRLWRRANPDLDAEQRRALTDERGPNRRAEVPLVAERLRFLIGIEAGTLVAPQRVERWEAGVASVLVAQQPHVAGKPGAVEKRGEGQRRVAGHRSVPWRWSRSSSEKSVSASHAMQWYIQLAS